MDDNILNFKQPTRDDDEALTLEQQVFEDFGEQGLFTIRIMTGVVESLMERIEEIEARLDSLSE